MNAADHDHGEMEPVIQGPGKQLREIRLAKDLDINQVAGLLHLNVTLLESLEADDFGKLPSPVFVQGYLRNYARLMDIPVAPILDAFQKCRPATQESMDLKATQIRREVRSSHTVVRLITWLIVIGIIALVVTWWRGYLQWPIDLGLESGTPVVAPPVESTPPATDGPPVAEPAPPPVPVGRPEILDAPVAETETGDSSDAAKPVPAEGVDAPAVEPSEAPGPDLTAPTGAETAETAPDAAPAVEALSPTSRPVAGPQVLVSFSDACWTEIRDASGSYRVIGNRTAGERLVLEGTPPYQMVFGNASAVSVLVDGVTYDLAPHTRSNVARFTLEPE